MPLSRMPLLTPAGAVMPGGVRRRSSGGDGQTFVNSTVLTGSGTYTVPADVTRIVVTMIGGGGSAGGANNGSGGGGGGGGCVKVSIDVNPEENYAYEIGAGGAASSGNGNAGGDTTFGTYSAGGGAGGTQGSDGPGGAGGTASGGDTNQAGGDGAAIDGKDSTFVWGLLRRKVELRMLPSATTQTATNSKSHTQKGGNSREAKRTARQ